MANTDFLIPRPLMCTVWYLENLKGGRWCGIKEMRWAAEDIRIPHSRVEILDRSSDKWRCRGGRSKEKELKLNPQNEVAWYGVTANHTALNQNACFISELRFHHRLLLFKTTWVGLLSWMGATWPATNAWSVLEDGRVFIQGTGSVPL